MILFHLLIKSYLNSLYYNFHLCLVFGEYLLIYCNGTIVFYNYLNGFNCEKVLEDGETASQVDWRRAGTRSVQGVAP